MTIRRRPGGRSARVREATLAATLDELAAVGYGELTVEGIARRAGVHKTTLYRRWGGVEALVLEAMLERARERVPVRDTGSLRGDLLALARAVVRNMTTPENEALIRAAAVDPTLADSMRRFWDERFALDGEIVERAIERGELPAGTDPKLVIETLLGPLYFRLLVTREPCDDAFVERVVDIVSG
jgi:AcrR family transcriptional regulator